MWTLALGAVGLGTVLGQLSTCRLNAHRQLQHREPGLLCLNLGNSSVCFSAAMCVLLQRTPEWFYPCSVKTDGHSSWQQEEIVTHPGSASLVLPELNYFSVLL